MQAIENKIINRIYGHGRGWAFFKNDFIDLGNAAAIDQSLSRLTRKSRIRRVMRGIYDYPAYSKLLDRSLPPDIDQVANALARKFGWTIQVSGNTALNILGISTQIPARYLYLSDGKSCKYKIGKQELSFKKAKLKDIGLKYPESALAVQAISALNKRALGREEKQKIRDYFDRETQKRILKDTKYTTSWIYHQLKETFIEGNHGKSS